MFSWLRCCLQVDVLQGSLSACTDFKKRSLSYCRNCYSVNLTHGRIIPFFWVRRLKFYFFFFFWCISFNSGHIWSFSKLSCAWNDIRNGVRMCSSKAIIQTKTSLSFTLWHFLRVLLKYFLIPWYHSFAHLHFLYMNKCFLWCLKGFTSGINIQEGLTKHIPPSQ